LLFCNGSGLTLQDIRPLLDPLTASFDLLGWDYRGFGRSAPVMRPYTMADVAADAAGLLEIAERLTAAGQDQQDPPAVAAQATQLQAREGHDVWDRLGAITCPTLVGYGNYDGIAPVHNSTNIASRIRGAELHGYEGGHGFLFQDPAALPAFIAFLQAPSS